MVAPTAQRSRSGPRRITAGSYSTMILRLAIVWAAVAPAGLAGAMARSGSADIRRAEQVRNMIWIYSRASGLTPALKGLCALTLRSRRPQVNASLQRCWCRRCPQRGFAAMRSKSGTLRLSGGFRLERGTPAAALTAGCGQAVGWASTRLTRGS